MNKNLLLSVFVLSVGILHAQKIYWSDISREEMIGASEISRSFLRHLEDKKVDSLKASLSHDSVYVGYGNWYMTEELVKELIEQVQGIPLRNVRITAYSFDDFLETYSQNAKLEGIYPVFDNHSVLIEVEYPGNRTGKPIRMVLKRESGRWIIAGIDGLGIETGDSTSPDFSQKGFRIEKIPEAGLEIPVPEDFSKPERAEGQVIFSLQEKTDRDAVFQVMIDEVKTKVHYYTYKFVEFSNQQYALSDLVVRYLPNGMLFEYTVIDSYGTKNKGITMGMQSRDKMVIIQFYAFYDIYQERKQQIMQVFNNIRS